MQPQAPEIRTLGYAVKTQAVLFLAGMPILSLPMWWGALAAARGYNLVQFGIVQTAGAAGATVSGLLLALLLVRIERRAALLTFCGLMIAAEGATYFVPQLVGVAALRFVFAFGNAGVTGVGWSYLALTASPSRSFGWYISLQTISQAFGLLVVPHIADALGVAGVQSFNVVLISLASLVALRLPPLKPDVSQDAEARVFKAPDFPWLATVLALCAWVLFYMFTNETFNYSERFGSARGLGSGAIGLVLSVTTLLGLPASLLVAGVGERFGIVRPLVLGAVLGLAASSLLLFTKTGEGGYFAGLAIFSAVWSLNQPFLMALFARLDPAGRILVASQPVQSLIGTVLSAGVTAATAFFGLGAVAVVAMICVMGSAASAALALRFTPREDGEPPATGETSIQIL